MLIGTGMDLCNVDRIAKSIERFGPRFLERVFTVSERERAERLSGKARAGAYAKRWAAKEACAKALGTGFSNGVAHADSGVENHPGGQPFLTLTGGAARHLAEMVPAGMVPAIFLSLTDDHPWAMAQVMIEVRHSATCI